MRSLNQVLYRGQTTRHYNVVATYLISPRRTNCKPTLAAEMVSYTTRSVPVSFRFLSLQCTSVSVLLRLISWNCRSADSAVGRLSGCLCIMAATKGCKKSKPRYTCAGCIENDAGKAGHNTLTCKNCTSYTCPRINMSSINGL